MLGRQSSGNLRCDPLGIKPLHAGQALRNFAAPTLYRDIPTGNLCTRAVSSRLLAGNRAHDCNAPYYMSFRYVRCYATLKRMGVRRFGTHPPPLLIFLLHDPPRPTTSFQHTLVCARAGLVCWRIMRTLAIFEPSFDLAQRAEHELHTSEDTSSLPPQYSARTLGAGRRLGL